MLEERENIMNFMAIISESQVKRKKFLKDTSTKAYSRRINKFNSTVSIQELGFVV